MDKPYNPYRKGSLIWSVMEGDWEDLTISQIADVLGRSCLSIRNAIWRIWSETGFSVPHADGRKTRWERSERDG